MHAEVHQTEPEDTGDRKLGLNSELLANTKGETWLKACFLGGKV